MTDAPATTPVQTTILELGHKAVTDPDSLTTAERVRLGSWIVDHKEHVAAHMDAVRASQGNDRQPQAVPHLGDWPQRRQAGALTERLAAQQPGATVEHAPVTQAGSQSAEQAATEHSA